MFGSKVLRRLAAAAAALVVGAVSLPTTAEAAVSVQLYVSPTGSGTACSTSQACTITQAQQLVRQDAPTMTGDIVVNLEGGTYPLAQTLTFGAADSGQNGYNVVWQAEAGQSVVLSGGTTLTQGTAFTGGTTNWTQTAGTTIWSTPVPAGLDTRQIYVNGQRADVASQPANTVFGTMTNTASGFTFTGTPPTGSTDNWAQSDVVYSTAGESYHWQQAVCPVTSISSGAVTEQTPCYTNADNNAARGPIVSVPTSVENDYALLGTPGQFYLDTTAHKIYYVPRTGENMTTASVTAAGLQTLVDIAGTSTSPVTHLTFTGLSFEYGTLLLGSQGVVDQQADMVRTSNPNVDAPLAANVVCLACQNVSFTGDTFAHLGGSALGFDGGGSSNTIEGNVVTDVSGNGIEIGDPGNYDPTKVNQTGYNTPPAVLESNYMINNNEVYNVANEFLGGVGIAAAWVTGTTIAHNEVWDTPYTGISLGYGWGYQSSAVMSGNHVDDNYVHDVMTSSLIDGGAIYLNGLQAAAGSTVTGNYIAQDSQNFAGLYLDNGSSNWNVSNNVVDGYVSHWLLVQSGAPSANDNTVTNNYVDAASGASWDNGNASNTVSSNTTGLTSWPTAAQTTIANAGLDSAHSALSGSGQTNLAYQTPATASSSWSSSFGPSNANDGAVGTPWASASGDTNVWWQTDLSAQHTLSDIQILFRQDAYDYATERQGFQVLVSNTSAATPSVSNGYTLACSQPATPLPYQARIDCQPPSGTWRYVAIVKTDGQSLALAQVRVFGAQSSVMVDDTDPGITYTGSWQPESYTGQYDNTQHYTTTVGDSFHYAFTGTGLDFVSTTAPNRGAFTYTTDSGTTQSGTCNAAASVDQQSCVSIRGLTMGRHTFAATMVNGQYFTLDALRVFG